MARKLPLEYEGAIYHVMNRGDRRETIFPDEGDRPLFLAILAEACQKAEWRLHSHGLMRRHFPFCLETSRANPVRAMK